jgi:hypothetical protein
LSRVWTEERGLALRSGTISYGSDVMTAQEWASKLGRRWYVLAAVLLCTMGGLWAVHGRSITYRGCD